MESKIPPLRKTYIERLNDPCDAQDMCDKYVINTVGCESMDEIKDRMLTHYWMLQNRDFKEKVGL